MVQTVSTRLRTDGMQQPYAEARVTRRLRELFDRFPNLAGFRLRSDLVVADIAVVSGSSFLQVRRLQVSLMQTFVELAECDPEAVALMRGRTFSPATRKVSQPPAA
jgi:hypothetical protein